MTRYDYRGGRHQRKLVSVLIAMILMLGRVYGQADKAPQIPHQKLSQKELKRLITAAATAEDHRRIAEYYRAEAARFRKQAKEHQDLASAYAQRKIYEPPKSGAFQHCQQFADFFKEAAEKADALAADHEELAGKVDH